MKVKEHRWKVGDLVLIDGDPRMESAGLMDITEVRYDDDFPDDLIVGGVLLEALDVDDTYDRVWFDPIARSELKPVPPGYQRRTVVYTEEAEKVLREIAKEKADQHYADERLRRGLEVPAIISRGRLGLDTRPHEERKEDYLQELWLRYYCDDACVLCGNSGVLDTRDVATCAGRIVGGLHHCICPNGRGLRRRGIAPEAAFATALQARHDNYKGPDPTKPCAHPARKNSGHEWYLAKDLGGLICRACGALQKEATDG